MGTRIKITPDVFEQVKKLLSTGLFDRKQIGEMTGISKASIDQIATFATLDEMRAAQKAAWELAQQRRKEKEEREKAAASAFNKAMAEEEEVHRVPIGDGVNTLKDKDENPSVQMDIIIEKMDTLISLLKEIHISQVKVPTVTAKPFDDYFNSGPKLDNEKPF